MWGIEYEQIDDWYQMDKLDQPFEAWRDYMEPATKSYYDRVVCESGPEHDFVRDLKASDLP
ncbi:MAG: hypothetical protein ABFE07_01705 [Armatimonadia bacterium]